MPQRKARELPKVGSEFKRIYRGKTHVLKVVKSDKGVAYELGGHIFETPTAAAKSLESVMNFGWNMLDFGHEQKRIPE